MPSAGDRNIFEGELALARELWEQSDTVGCETILRDLLAREPVHEGATWLLATLLQTQGRLDTASALVFDWCRAQEFAPQHSLRAAQFIQQCQRQATADELCEATLARHSTSAAFLALAGHVAREIGDFDRARVRYLAALDAGHDSNSSFVLGALAHTLRYENASHADFARFIGHLDDTRISPRARAATGFGLAKAYDDIGDYASAARTLRQANALVRAQQAWSPAHWHEFVAQRMRERVAGTHASASADFVPVFVLGLPRTGTTLTATRLARHARARDRGELRTLRFIAERLIAGNHLQDARAIEEAAALYFAHARQDDAPATWYVDQDPLNFRYLHVIAAMFPQARIIVCTRAPRDTALSLWSQDFAHADCAFAYDFSDIAEYMSGYAALLKHWRDTLSLRIHTAAYEDFVADPNTSLADMRKFVGMPEAEFTPYREAGPINTSSVWQARQTVYSRSVGRWRAYASYVPELMQFDPR
jgi:tetratricopeptide (TPR) repeat protein